MLPTLICRAALLAACLTLALPALADQHESEPQPAPEAADAAADEAAAPDAPPAGTVGDARALIDAGRFGEALVILTPMVQGDAVDANVAFLYGLAAVGTAQQQPDLAPETREALLSQAVAAFRAMLIEDPRLLRVRLELARAFYLMGEDDLARRHFEIVLATDPPDAVVANVRTFLASIESRRRWRFNAGAALAPDSNIGGSSEERIIYIFDLPFRRNVQELTSSGIGVSLWGGAEYHYPVFDDLRIRAGAEFARREYERSVFDQLFVGTHLGPRWLVDRDTDLSVLGSARQRWVGTAPDDRELGVRLEVGHRVNRLVTVSGQASWHGRRYRTRTALDGPVMDVALRASWVVDPTVRLDFSGGYGRQRPKWLSRRHRTRWLGTDVSVILPLGFTVGAGAEVRWADYEPGWFPFVPDNGARQDRTRSLRASVHNRGFTVFGFSPELVVVNEERETNAQAHDFQRTRGELRFVQQF